VQPYRNVIGTHERVGSRPGARLHRAHVGPWSANLWQPCVADLRGHAFAGQKRVFCSDSLVSRFTRATQERVPLGTIPS
jgi:hypothetical protein